MKDVEWSQEKFCHVGNSPQKINENMPKGIKPKLFLTDPPYNIGHKYGDVSDRLSKKEYSDLIRNVLNEAYNAADNSAHFFMIHYPKDIAELLQTITKETKWVFHQWITWTYPSNIGMSKNSWTTASRAIIWLQKKEGGKPKFYPKRIVRPYKNPWDRRVGELIKSGKKGCSLYDWWQINLVKNVNIEKSDYSNQIPKVLLQRIIRSTTDIGDLVVDPFSGTFSTVKAALSLGRLGWGCDLNEDTKSYWPNKEDFNNNFIETRYDFDIPLKFDFERAGITEKQYVDILRKGAEILRDQNKEIAASKIFAELERIGWE